MHAVANTPAEPLKHVARAPQRQRPSPSFGGVSFRITPFRGLLSVHSRYGLHARQVAHMATLYIEDFVTVRQEVTGVSVRFLDAAVADFFDGCVDRGLKPHQFSRA